MGKSIKHMCVALLTIAAGVSCHGMRVDLSDYTDLTDKGDDSAGLQRAIAEAGDGGVVYIPAGNVVLNKPINVKDQSVILIGAGRELSVIEADFNEQHPAFTFLSTKGNKDGCRWSIRALSMQAGVAGVEAAFSFKDETGVRGGSEARVQNIELTSGIKNYFIRGVVIDGMARVELESCGCVGELRDNPGEAKGMLTKSHVLVEGGGVKHLSIFRSHLRMADRNVELQASVGEFLLRQVSMVQCEYGVYQEQGVRCGRFDMHGCASQLIVPLSLSNHDFVGISSSRFALVRTKVTPPSVILEKTDSSLTAGNFLKRGAKYNACQQGVIFGNHVGFKPDAIELNGCKEFAIGSTMVAGRKSLTDSVFNINASSSIDMSQEEDAK